MHHRRSHTSKRESNRLDSKAFRQAEKRALDRPPSVPPSDHWGRGSDLPIPDDIPSNGKKRGNKKVGKPKEKCPVNGTHEWYKEWVEEEDYYVHYTRCHKCSEMGRGYVFGCSVHNEKHYYTVRNFNATCIHCWKTKTLKTLGGRWVSWRENRVRNRKLPKRPVQF